ncbi:MAG: hypothetical protein PQJ46_08895 [Spirochaetales bacterium]|nr:hypothetical protein [Spirochaetales bacterium]
MNIKALKVVNILLGIDFLLIAVTAILHNFIMVTGLYFYFHAVPGFLFLVLVCIHIILNRKWIKSNYFSGKKK